jgi:hypothetical protein
MYDQIREDPLYSHLWYMPIFFLTSSEDMLTL